ncbi:L-threonylcarbamoyladenylate synthase [Spiroplasma endosymbiont of Crioceris asparagi]|uniref:L-threonylcarbamoyladenylate synthase n=1 Tax=Spiroplasma endosymbiont of Crioceris asparagi TaxID=3066286 RepID=UPI0030CCB9AA
MNKKNIDSIIEKLKNNEIVLIPTDTVYGLSAIAGNEENQTRINKMKKRELDKKLIILISSLEMVKEFNLDNEAIEKLKSNIPTTVIVGNETKNVAYRLIKDNCYLKSIIDEVGPIYSTSANFSAENYICDKKIFKKIINSCDNFYWNGKNNCIPSKIFDNINKTYVR